ncbi:hypothetical protein Ptr902_08554 [Pyrenophora tritici-repentis]|nr:hypothetical protein Ptr902_08554 [Pyrenophora tritici-repentis]
MILAMMSCEYGNCMGKMVTCSRTSGACVGVGVGLGLCGSRMLLLRDPDCLDPGVSVPPFLIGVVNLKDPFSRSWELWCASTGGGDDMWILRPDSLFRKRGRSLRARAPASLAGSIDLDKMDVSEDTADTKL